MKITKATRWRVFAGVWIQSLFTSATAFFSLFALPLTTQFGWSSSEFSMAYTIYMFVYCAMGFVGGLLAEKLQPRVAIYLGLIFFAAGWFLTGFASSIPQMVKTPIFWVMLVMFIFANAVGTMMVSATSPIAKKQIGQSAMCVSIMRLANMIGRISFGFIYDKLKGWNSLILVLVLNGISMCMLTVAHSLPYFILCICLVGFSFGGLLVVFAPIVKNVFGSRFYNRNYGLIFIGYGIGAFVGPKISASFYDATASCVMGDIGSAILAAVAVLLVFVAKKLNASMQAAN